MSALDIDCIPLDDVEKARKRLTGCIQTPLIRLNVDDILPDDRKIYLKLENLQVTGSFKQRGAGNALAELVASKGRSELCDGVYTCSSGNFAIGLAYNARRLGIPCTVIVPDTAPKAKVEAMKRYGAHVVSVPYDHWWNAMMTHEYPGMKGSFIHPIANRFNIAGNGTVALEILEQLPEVDVIICSFGVGSLCGGVGSVMKSLKKGCHTYACEVDVAAPLSASLASGQPSEVVNHKSSFADGMGGKSLLPEMWPLARNTIQDNILLTEENIAKALKLLVERSHIVAEGAGAAPVAAALGWHSNTMLDLAGKNIVCIISGGNIELNKLSLILDGITP